MSFLTGAIARTKAILQRAKTGAVSFSGTALGSKASTAPKTWAGAGALSITGTVKRLVQSTRTAKTGSLGFSGDGTNGTRISASGTVYFYGVVEKTVSYFKAADGVSGLSGEVPEAWKEMLFYGVRN